MAASTVLCHSGLMRCPSSSAKSHHHLSTLPSHLKRQQHHLWCFSKGSITRPRSISVSGLRRRQIPCIKAKATTHSESFWDRADALKEEWKKRLGTLPVQKLHEHFEVEKELSPLGIAKWAAWASLVVCAMKLLVNPYVWMYSSWYLVVWPWPTAFLLGIASLVIAYRRSKRKASEWEQYLMVTGALTWLIIVPHAHLNGFIEGWPLNLFFVYYAYFLINFYLRKTVYGSVDAPSDIQIEWMRKNSLSKIGQIAFLVSMMVGHWAGAYESPVLRGGGGNHFWACGVIFIAMVLHYYGSYFFLKYAAGQVRPVGVVMFGPYRWIRHPVYASNMWFLVGCFMGIRAYLSLGFVLVVSLLYYRQKSNLEEDMMVEAFGESYINYRTKVKHKYLPFIF